MSTEEQKTNFEKLCVSVYDAMNQETIEYLTEEMGFIKWGETYHNLQVGVMRLVVERLAEKMNLLLLSTPTKKSVGL